MGLSARSRKIMSEKTGACMQRGPNPPAFRTPFQGLTGCGAFQRNSPMGGAAKGIPRKARTAGEAALTPSTIPLVVFTWSSANVAPANGISSNPANAAMRARPLPRVISPPGLVAYHNRDPPVFPLDLAKQRQRKSTRATTPTKADRNVAGFRLLPAL